MAFRKYQAVERAVVVVDEDKEKIEEALRKHGKRSVSELTDDQKRELHQT